MHSFSYVDGSLHCEGVKLTEIAERFGTPAYVYSANTIRGNYQRLDRALAPLDHPFVCLIHESQHKDLRIFTMIFVV